LVAPWQLLRATFREWWNDDVFQFAAALAFYTIFSIAPIVTVALWIAGIAFFTDAATSALVSIRLIPTRQPMTMSGAVSMPQRRAIDVPHVVATQAFARFPATWHGRAVRKSSSLVLALSVASALSCRSPVPGDPQPPEAAASTPAQAVQPVLAPGSQPSAPLSRDSAIDLSAIRVAVLGVARGDNAAERLPTAATAQPATPNHLEPLLVHLSLTGVRDRSWVGCKDFRVIGSSRVAYFHGVHAKEALHTRSLEGGESVEGWCSYAIPVTERDLLLMVNEPDSRDPAALRYVALEDGAALSDVAAPALRDEKIGSSASAPAPLGSEIVTQEWSVTAVEILRGEPAQDLVADANSNNPAPAPGLEFLAVKLHARYIGRSGKPGLFSASQFQILSDSGEPYARPIVLDVKPRLSRTLLPGGEHTGWAVFQVAPHQLRPLLRFTPYYPDEGERFIALKEST
jgi:hypothetical protein